MAENQLLTVEDRALIFEQGKQAAINKASPFSCPYTVDKADDRFDAWVEGFRSVSDLKRAADRDSGS